MQKIMKYNPAFLSDDELKASFVARSREFQQILGHLNAGPEVAKRHLLIHGPRGSGKTTLVLRVAAEIRENPEFSQKFLPIVFPEELYEVTTVDEFWQAALSYLGESAVVGDSNGPLSSLIRITKEKKVRLLLVVENFDMLVESQLSPDDIANLQATLKSELGIQLLATACRNFRDWEDRADKWVDFFTSFELEPLDDGQCSAIWQSITDEEPEDGRIKALRILTGGNPRLLAVISSFGKGKSFKQLMDDLIQLIDDHTDYFKGQLDSLASTERKVYLALTRLWKPSTAKEVSEAAGLDVSATSSLLHRLMKRGKVELFDKKGRVKWYQVSERLFNIYYLMRTGGSPSGRIKALVDILVVMYGQKRSLEIIVNEACCLSSGSRELHYTAYEFLLNVQCSKLREFLVADTPPEFLQLPDLPETLNELTEPKIITPFEGDANQLLKLGAMLANTHDQKEHAAVIFKKVTKLLPKEPAPWFNLGLLYINQNKYLSAEKALRRLLELTPDHLQGHCLLAEVLSALPGKTEEAKQAYERALEFAGDTPEGWAMKAELNHKYLGEYGQAKEAYEKYLKNDCENPFMWFQYGLLCYEHLNENGLAEEAFRTTIKLSPEFLPASELLGQLLYCDPERRMEAITFLRKAIELGTHVTEPFILLTSLLSNDPAYKKDALEPIKELFDRPDVVTANMKDAIDTVIWLANEGYAQNILELIKGSASVKFLEPVIAALQLHIGIEIKVPTEIHEVAIELLKQIHSRKPETAVIAGGDEPPE